GEKHCRSAAWVVQLTQQLLTVVRCPAAKLALSELVGKPGTWVLCALIRHAAELRTEALVDTHARFFDLGRDRLLLYLRRVLAELLFCEQARIYNHLAPRVVLVHLEVVRVAGDEVVQHPRPPSNADA